jgi:orotate phosphoribosyltransferase
MREDLFDLVAGREGHFRLESGHHSKLWLDLDPLFVQPDRVRPLVDALAQALRAHEFAGVCGPLVGGAFLAQMLASVLAMEFFFTERVIPAGRDGLYRAEYRLPQSLRERVRGKRLAIVDDAISAGSAVRGTYAELQKYGAQPVVVGGLLVLGSAALDFFVQEGLPVEAATRAPFELWAPAECPLCASQVRLEDVASATQG